MSRSDAARKAIALVIAGRSAEYTTCPVGDDLVTSAVTTEHGVHTADQKLRMGSQRDERCASGGIDFVA
jgi:hypothetical protein